jgi:hypothetical protein
MIIGRAIIFMSLLIITSAIITAGMRPSRFLWYDYPVIMTPWPDRNDRRYHLFKDFRQSPYRWRTEL